MGAFQSGFQMGGELANQAVRNEIAQRELAIKEAAEGRAAEEFKNRQADRTREDNAFTNYSNLAGGINQDTQAQVGRTYGMNPAQIAAAVQNGGAEGLRAKLAGYDQPDSYDLQNVPNAPAGGLQPRFDASQLKATEPSRLDRERALEQISVARRDTQGIRQSQQAQRTIQIDDITAGVMKRDIADIEKLAPDINMSGYPLLYTGKTKNGYTFLKTQADGKTPIPGSEFKLNESQLRQLALSHELGAAGFGTEALNSLSAAHKDIGDHVAKWNSAQTQSATTSNQAAIGDETSRHNKATEAATTEHNANLRDYYKQRGLAERMGGAQYFTGTDGNTYAAIPTMGKDGLTFQTAIVNPQGIKLAKMGGQAGKPVDVKEEGSKVTFGDRLMYADGMGGYIPAGPNGQPLGVMPSQRGSVLKKAGLNDNQQGRLQWSSDGTGVRFGNREYNPTDPADIQSLIKDVTSYDVMQQRIDESMAARRSGLGINYKPESPYVRNPLAY